VKLPRSWALARQSHKERDLRRALSRKGVPQQVSFQAGVAGQLAELFWRYGSDKDAPFGTESPFPWPTHTYASVYAQLFDHCRSTVSAVFECGIGTTSADIPSNMTKFGSPGASLRAWRDYFPNAQIFGADIDESALFQEDRISTFCVDQTSPDSVAAMWSDIGMADFDLMIDDGLHSLDAAINLFQGSWPHLRSGGVYVIEDVNPSYMGELFSFVSGLGHWTSLVLMERRDRTLFEDNALLVVRKAYEAGSVP